MKKQLQVRREEFQKKTEEMNLKNAQSLLECYNTHSKLKEELE